MTCRKAKASLSKQGVKLTERELAKQALTRDEALRFPGGNAENLIDKKNPSCRTLGIGDTKLRAAEAVDLMGQNPSIICRPIFDINGEVMIGYKELDRARKPS